jgi:hypothetical protein
VSVTGLLLQAAAPPATVKLELGTDPLMVNLLVEVAVHPLSLVTVSDTSYSVACAYLWLPLRNVEVFGLAGLAFGSPKFHNQPAIVPVATELLSVNWEIGSFTQFSGSPNTAFGNSLIVIVLSRSALLQPLSVTTDRRIT